MSRKRPAAAHLEQQEEMSATRPIALSRGIAAATALASLLLAGCAAPGRNGSAPGDSAPPPGVRQPSAESADDSSPATASQADAPALSPALQAQRANWETFRGQIRNADWTRVDAWYRQFAAAVPRENPDAYRDYFAQSEAGDPATRANGYIGMAASNPKAATGALIRALDGERDWNNRTILVWSLRLAAGPPDESRSRRVTGALWDYVAKAPDADYGICLDTSGSPTLFRSPTPLAAPEAFKALIELKGRDVMLDGEGWKRVMDRLTRHVDTQALQLDPRWLDPGGAADPRSRETEAEAFERLMRELDGDNP